VKILNRYVLKEHAGPLSFAVAALTSLLLLDYIAKNIGQLVGKGLPWTVIAEFIGLSVPFTIAMTLPMAVLVSVLYAFSRLAAENEITALKASGVSLGRILIPVVIGATGLTIFMVLFNDQVLPRANHRLRTLQGDIARKKPTFALRARVLNEVSPGKLFLIANHLDAGSNRMREVVIYDLGDPTRERTIYADSGTMAMVPETGDLIMTLFDGNMDELKKAELSELQRLYYKVDHIRVKGVGDQLVRSNNDDYKSEREMTICEMQSDVGEGARSHAEAQAIVERALVGAVRTAATGAPASLDVRANLDLTSAQTRPHRTIGRVYCDAQASFLRFVARHRSHPGPLTAAAPVQAHPQPAPPPTPPPSTPHVAGGDTARAGVAVSIGHPPSGPPPRPVRALPPSAGGGSSYHPMPGMAQASALPQHTAPKPAPNPALKNDQDRLPTPGALHPGQGHVPVVQPPLVPPVRFAPSPNAIVLQTLSNTVESADMRVQEATRNIALYDVEIEKKFAIAFACIIFVFLGAPIALRFPRGGVGMVLGVSLGVFAIYYIGLIAGEPLGDRGTFTPFVAMWASNILFSIAGAFLMANIGREGSTARGGDWGEMKDAIIRRYRTIMGTAPQADTVTSAESA
jgi:lipopolysaccharide export system permease protein